MDGIHDLGGREGFGPVDVSTEYDGFHADWEARMFGIVRTMGRGEDWNLDWFRHCRELIDPVDYLSRPYYDQWLQSYAAMLINSGLATTDEIASGKSQAPLTQPTSEPLPATDVQAQINRSQRFDGAASAPARFAPDNVVRTVDHGISTHTRLPAYARGATGIVTHYRGDHVYPDTNALNQKQYMALYTVSFKAGELWGDAAHPDDEIHLDLWEAYLEPAN